jgi:hypothetical protein
MKTFYSILSAVINPVTGEKISLGLLLSDGNKSLFGFSDSRFSLIGTLIDKESKKFIRQYLRSIDNVIQKIDINQDQHTILEYEGKNLIINEPYITYLSTYSQNVVSFSKPVSITIEVKEDVFQNLFTKFIDDETVVETTKKSNFQLVKTAFFPRIQNHFTIEKEFSPEENSKLFLPISIDLFGKNERYVMGQFLDLEKNIYHVKNDYFDYHQLTEVYSKSHKFLISSEPNKEKFPQQHYFWNEIRKHRKHQYVDTSELDVIEQYAIQHQVQPV